MFIEQRLTNVNEPWTRLPYAVSGNGWTSELLAAGGTYQYRLVPSKGFSTGVAGGTSTTTASGPTPGPTGNVIAINGGNSPEGGKKVLADWTRATNASGYYLSQRNMLSSTWDTLPYPVTSESFTFGLLPPGRYMRFRVQPIRGYLTAAATSSSTVRVNGLPGDRHYAALGDSYSSGLGASGGYVDAACKRTGKAWPLQLQTSFIERMENFSCAGDRRGDVREDQMEAMESFFSDSGQAPRLITLTVGGNDVGFSDVAHDCIVMQGSCTSLEESTSLSIDNRQQDLAALYAAIKVAQPYSDIIVGGYPNVVEPGASGGFPNLCDAFGNDERAMAERLVIRLNSRISSAASTAGVWTVGGAVRSKFLGHSGCGSAEWIFGPVRNGFSVDDRSFHPNDAGQLGYALVFSDALISRAN